MTAARLDVTTASEVLVADDFEDARPPGAVIGTLTSGGAQRRGIAQNATKAAVASH